MPTLRARSEADTGAIAKAFTRLLRPGDTVLLEGPLGSGKTSFARALLRTLLGDPALVVPSPTFSLVQPYEGRGHSLLHIDLFRLANAREAGELGIVDDLDAIRLIEWPERLPSLAAEADWRVTLSQGKKAGARRLDIAATRDSARQSKAAAVFARWA